MKVCGVDISGSEARLAIAQSGDDGIIFCPCSTKKISLLNDKDDSSVRIFLQTLKTFAHENAVHIFVLRARAQGGPMGGGAVSFKIEGLFQLTECGTSFVHAPTLAKFAKSNQGGIPNGVLRYQEDAYRCAAHFLTNQS